MSNFVFPIPIIDEDAASAVDTIPAEVVINEEGAADADIVVDVVAADVVVVNTAPADVFVDDAVAADEADEALESPFADVSAPVDGGGANPTSKDELGRGN